LPALAALAAGILLYNSRAIYVSLASGLCFLALTGICWMPKGFRVTARRTLIVLLLAAGFLLTLTLQIRQGASLLTRTAEDLESGFLHFSEDPNAEFRFMAWAEAWRRFGENPLLGEGFGVPFVFYIFEADPRPHNTYLTVLYKMGIVGFLPLSILLGGFFLMGTRAIIRHGSHEQSIRLYLVLVGQVVTSVYGAFALLLESPFLASIFWLSVGVGMRIISLLEVTGETPRLIRR